jgi:4-hydroxy-3-methylbut-2-enyl diphosphate reductase
MGSCDSSSQSGQEAVQLGEADSGLKGEEQQVDENRYFKKGLGMRAEILPILDADYRSGIVDWLQTHGRRLEQDGTTILLAREFGFCYGVDRAVEYAYETRRRFPDRRIHNRGDHPNPWVNQRLQEMGIHRIPPADDEVILGDLDPRTSY